MWRRGLGLVAVLAMACGSSDDPGETETALEALPPLAEVALSDSVTLLPAHPVLSEPDERSPSAPDALRAMLEEGYGEIATGPGEPHQARTPDGSTPPAPGPNAHLLTRFAHLPDFQLADDESPTRGAFFDSPVISSGMRPHESYMCLVLNAAVRTLNAVHAAAPLDFLLLGGDNVDSAQQNELDWVIDILSGNGVVECDSGLDDDPVSGASNDPKDPFVPVGLEFPWLWVSGNHDILVQGLFELSEQKRQQAFDERAPAGTRDWSQPGGPTFGGPVVLDEARLPLLRAQIMERVAADADGHGIGQAEIASGKATYARDIEGTPLRLLVLDTAAETGGSEGLIRRGDVDALIRPALDQARADGKWVILASHHASDKLEDGLAGDQTDAVLEPEWLSLLDGYDNVLFSLVGHSHWHRVKYLQPGAFWELQTGALADFPHQGRVVEIWDQDNGWLMLRSTLLDFSTEGDALAERAREIGFVDFVSGWTFDARGDQDARNVELWIPAP